MAQPQPQPDTRYITTKPDNIRAEIYSKIKQALIAKFPIESSSLKATLSNVEVEYKPLPHSAQKKLRMSGGNASTGVYGDIEISNMSDGKVVNTLKHHRIMNIPYFTDRYTFLLDGNEYSIVNQLRTKSGVYTRKRGNDELESSFNLSKGANFKILMDPTSGMFKVSILHATLPLLAVLKVLGADKAKIEKSMGAELYKSNAVVTPAQQERTIEVLYEKLVKYKSNLGDTASKAEKISGIRAYFSETSLNPETTKITLGSAHTSVSVDTILAAVVRMLGVYNEDDDVDDRDGLEFQNVYTPDDILKEVLEKSTMEVNKLKAKLDTFGYGSDAPVDSLEGTKKLKAIFSPSVFTRPVRSFLTTSSISRLPDQINPMEIMDSASIVTRLGEGAISSEQAVPEETRAVNYSYMGLIDPVMAPESSKIGIDNRFAMGARKGNVDHELYKDVLNNKTGEQETHRAIDLYDKYVGFPDDLSERAKKDKAPNGMVSAVHMGKLVDVKRSQLDFQIPSPHHLNALATNNIPFLNANQANRILMGAKHQSQAMPLKYRETRLVEPVITAANTRSTVDKVGSFLIPKSPVDGVVTRISDDYVYVKDAQGVQHQVDYANHMPLTAKTSLHNNLSVVVGDKVKKGDALGDNTFTKDGKSATGVNLNIAYMPYKGYNHEDGIVISESASKRLTSLHTDTVQATTDKTTIQGKSEFVGAYPSLFSAAQLANIDEEGVAKKGVTLQTGDPVILLLGDARENRVNQILGKFHKSLIKPYSDLSEVYTGNYPAEVVDVHSIGKHIAVQLEIEKPAGIGDKLSGTYGNKGVITRIEPDDKIFQDESGKPLDIVFTSAGVIGRINPAQTLETTLGKIATKTGVPYKIENYSHDDYVEFVRDEMKKHNVSDKDTLTDPETGKKISGIFTGVQHIQKLHKTTDTNFSGRGVVGPHDQDDSPVGSGDAGPKALGGMEVNALLAHNSRAFLKDSTMLRGAKNSEFWNNFQYGGIAHFPQDKKTFNKFTTTLKQAGINITKQGDTITAGPLTDKDIMAMSSGEIKNALRVNAKDASPEQGGLFDIVTTGGLDGDRWSHITLAEPVINPVFEDCVASLLDLSKKDLEAKYNSDGGDYLRKKLNSLDVAALLKKTEAGLDDVRLKGIALDKQVRKMKYLRTLNDRDLKAGDGYMLSCVPVTPPKMRPVTIGGVTGDLMPHDSNEFYKNLILNNQAFKDIKGQAGFNEAKVANRSALQQSVRELVGVVAPSEAQLRNRNAKGAIKFIAGDVPKHGFFQRKVIYSKMNLAGRATITPDETLGLDEVGMPEDMAWDMYTPFILRKLTMQGYTAADAKTEIENKTDKAKSFLEAEMDERPVVLNRAPTLWKHSIMSAKPKLRSGKSLGVNSLWEASYNADYDGDSSLNSIVYRAVQNENNRNCGLTNPNSGSILADSSTNPLNIGEHTMPFANTNLRTSHGLINLQDFPRVEASKRVEGNKEMYDVPVGTEVLSVMDGVQTWLPVEEYSIHKGLKMLEIETSSGRTIHCSSDDSLITLDADLKYTKAQPRVGLSLPRVLGAFAIPDEANALTTLRVEGNTSEEGVTFNLDRDFGWLAGAFVGDGWLNEAGYSTESKVRNAVMLCKDNSAFRAKWEGIINSYTPGQHFTLTNAPHEFNEHASFSQKLTCHHTILKNYFRDHHSHTALKKSLPHYWMLTTEEFRWGLLAGLIDSAGTVSEVKAKAKKYSQLMVVYTSISKALIYEIVALGNSLGLTVTATFGKMTEAGNESWSALFNTASIRKMQENLTLQHSEKRERLSNHEFRPSTLDALDTGILTPKVSLDRLKELRSVVGSKILNKVKTVAGKKIRTGELAVPEAELAYWKSRNSLYATLTKTIKDNSALNMHAAKKVFALDLPLLRDNAFWAKWKTIVEDESITWETVTSLRPIPEITEAYDITAPPNFTMVTEAGFVIQDTMQVHLPVTDEAVAEMNNMLPSKLLFSDKQRGELLMMPSQEPITGLYTVTKNLGLPRFGVAKKYKTEADAWAAYNKGELKMVDNMEIG